MYQAQRSYLLERREPFTIGRDPSNSICIADSEVSGRHCTLRWTGDGFLLEDHSTNGTFINGQRMSAARLLGDGQEFTIGLNRFRINGETVRFFPPNSVWIDVCNLTYEVPDNSPEEKATSQAPETNSSVQPAGGTIKRLLNDVSFRLYPHTIIGFIGGSGAGKSTLMKAMVGFQQATSGHVFINGLDLYSHLESFRRVIGYVPQDDILHRELTVETILNYAAQLRLPEGTPQAQIQSHIGEVLTQLKLTHRRNSLVSTLSGGERKRVNVAVELIAKPGLLFLDEPTTGLSPDFEVEFMELLRHLTREEGQTIIMVTHSERCIESCDILVVVALGGRIAYVGPREDALQHFGATNYANLLSILNDKNIKQPEEWESYYHQNKHYKDYQPADMEQGLQEGESPNQVEQQLQTILSALRVQGRRPSFFTQWKALTSRYVDCLLADWRNLMFLILQPCIIGLLLSFSFSSHVLQFRAIGTSAEIVKTPIFVAMMVLTTSFFSLSLSIRELVKESPLFRREYGAGVGTLPYLLSKLAPLSAICLGQIIVFGGIVALRNQVGGNVGSGATYQVWAVLLCLAISCMTLGLLISALVKTENAAVTMIPFTLLPLFLCSGWLGLASNALQQGITRLTPTYWANCGLFGAYRFNEFLQSIGMPDNIKIAGSTSWQNSCLFNLGLSAILLMLTWGILEFKYSRHN